MTERDLISDLQGQVSALALLVTHLLRTHPDRAALIANWDADVTARADQHAKRWETIDPVFVEAMLNSVHALAATVGAGPLPKRSAAEGSALMERLLRRPDPPAQ